MSIHANGDGPRQGPTKPRRHVACQLLLAEIEPGREHGDNQLLGELGVHVRDAHIRGVQCPRWFMILVSTTAGIQPIT
jgi:hypothetical protein